MTNQIAADYIDYDKINKLTVLTERVIKRREALLAETQPHICSERSRLVTESWQETEGQPVVIRRAKLFQKIMEGISVTIRDGELIVGSQTRYIRGSSPPVDFHSGVGYEAIRKPTGNSQVVQAILTEEDKQQLLQDANYWKGRAPGEVINGIIEETGVNTLLDLLNVNYVLMLHEQPSAGRTLDFTKVINEGLLSVIGEINEEIKNLDYTVQGNIQKYQFLKAGLICCDAVIKIAHRYAELARDMAKCEDNAGRKKELLIIAENCERVPEYPARTFHEAVQCFWTLFLALNLEAASQSESPGRLDQYLYPLYKKDITEGKITRQEAAELLGCLWVKFNEMEMVKGLSTQQRSMGSQFQNVTISGVTRDGKDATNELSALMLEVAAQMKMNQPPLYIRYHTGMSDEFLAKAIDTNRRHGAGIPCFINNDITVQKIVERGVDIADARDFLAAGCIGVMLPNGPNGETMCGLNINKVWELALNNGYDPVSCKQLSPVTGDPRTFETFEQLYNAFLKQCEFGMNIAHKIHCLEGHLRGQLFNFPFTSVLIGGCVKNGKDYTNGGARYPNMGVGIDIQAQQTVADGLTAIKKLVYEDKKISMTELLDALAANYEGKETLRQMLLTAPKYGNDDNYADEVHNRVCMDITGMAAQRNDWQGYPTMFVMRGGGSGHFAYGIKVGATPDGRKAFTPVADANLSPVQGMDEKGPTAVLLSATKVNQTKYAMTTLLNMKIMPSVVQTQEGIMKVVSLVKTFFGLGGWHIQFNMIDQQTLLEAQKHPEQYRNLMVRVGGYSAYFVDLTPEVQNDIINRMQHTL